MFKTDILNFLPFIFKKKRLVFIYFIFKIQIVDKLKIGKKESRKLG